jgi:hypothetical protein
MMKLYIMNSPPASCYFLRLRSKYSSPLSVLIGTPSIYVVSFGARDQVLHPYKTTGKNTIKSVSFVMVVH